MLRQVALAALSVLPLALGQVAEDFESGWDKVAWPTYAPDCDQGGSVELDKTTAHSGKNSIKVTGGPNGFCGHKFFGTDAVPEGHVYVRTWMKTAKAFDDSHVTFITMPDAAQGNGKHLRIGGQSKIMMYNHESDDATLPDLSPDGIAASKSIPANTWQCLEYHLSPDGTIATWLNDNPVLGLVYKPDAPASYAGGWARSKPKPKVQGVYFGWESYSGAVNTFWFDDIAISSERIGCAVKK
ncbi:carbohydrate-binding module family 1 [Fusarium sp. NRRL 52700]|nr:carbohydrate-binding module family 1 [Fusarium sp. NRRL 52700]